MLIEDIAVDSQVDLGEFTPRANQKTHSSAFAIREGSVPSGWRTIQGMKDGVRIGGTNKRIGFTEYLGEDGKPHDLDFGGIKLREMVCDREDVIAKDRLEGEISTRAREAIEFGTGKSANGIGISPKLERSQYEVTDNREPVAPEPNKGGRPRKQPAE